jgi:23S rRNA (cytidine2498-2'-O)-methyltransferase
MTMSAAVPWLIRIPAVFAGFAEEILKDLGTSTAKPLGRDWFLVKLSQPSALRESRAAKFVRWNLPAQHTWPCAPQSIDRFVEKAASALAAKFGNRNPQALKVGALDPGSPNRSFRTLASNLRGRALQLFPPEVAQRHDEDQDPHRESLFCLVGKEGLFAGMQSPHSCNGFYPGGTKYIGQSASSTISRAGAKLAEALHLLPLHRPLPPQGSHWLELGASPGGMTAELLDRSYHVTAVDRAPLDARLHGRPNLVFARDDVATFAPSHRRNFDAILCDLNGPALTSLAHLIRVSEHLARRGLIIFTLKGAGAESYVELNEVFEQVATRAAAGGLTLLATTHLTYNRREFTLFFTR